MKTKQSETRGSNPNTKCNIRPSWERQTNIWNLRVPASYRRCPFRNFCLQRRFRQLGLNPEYIFHALVSVGSPSLKRKIHPGRLLQFPFKSHSASRWKSFGERFVTKWKRSARSKSFIGFPRPPPRPPPPRRGGENCATKAFRRLPTAFHPFLLVFARLCDSERTQSEKVSKNVHSAARERRRTLNTWLVPPR